MQPAKRRGKEGSVQSEDWRASPFPSRGRELTHIPSPAAVSQAWPMGKQAERSFSTIICAPFLCQAHFTI